MRNIAGILGSLLAICMFSGCITNQTSTDALQGTWVVTAAEHEGKSMDAIVGGTLAISGAEFHIHTISGKDLAGRLQVANDKNPKEMDLIHANGMHWLGIYEVKKEVLRLNYLDVTLKEPRPVQFVTASNTEASLLTLRKSGAK